MPKENIERAIKKGTGELEGEQVLELFYEGLGPFNSQFIIKCLTDNKNRSASSVRHTFTKIGGSLTPVMWNFDKKGVIKIGKMNISDIELDLIDSGAEDIINEEDNIVIYTDIANLNNVKDLLEKKKVEVESGEIEYVPKDTIKLDDSQMETINRFIESLEDNEDVTDFYSNVDF
jgi:YebC/PmpR family DNA-binding regulatory protein